MYNAKNHILSIGGDTMACISFGVGAQPLILLPGLGDGLKTVKGMALPFSLLYRKLAREYRVYVFSRRDHLPLSYSCKEMAADAVLAMDALGIDRAHIVGVSQGGAIAQQLAIHHPQRVNRLVLAATYARPNDAMRAVLTHWIACAQSGDYARLMIDTAERSYSEAYLQKSRRMYWLLTKVGKPKSFARFLTQAQACLSHDVHTQLPQAACQTLVIGGWQDRIVTAQASIELAAQLPNSQLFMYGQWGHGLYEEAPDFWDRVIRFLRQ